MKAKIIIVGAALLIFAVLLNWLSHNEVTSITSVNTHDSQPQPSKAKSTTTQKSPRAEVPATQAETHSAMLPSKMLVEMRRVAAETEHLLLAAPNDATGKLSRWFKPLSDWQTLLIKASQTGTREDFFALVPSAAAFFARDREAEPLAESLDEIRFWMQHPAPQIIRELSKAAVENGGRFDSATSAIALQVFTVKGFLTEPDWEDERMPIDRAGVLIALAHDSSQFDKLSSEQLSRLFYTQDPQIFFMDYQSDGKGLPVLRQQFESNREVTLGIFNALSAKAAAYKASAQAK
jgi:hypothetical protein